MPSDDAHGAASLTSLYGLLELEALIVMETGRPGLQVLLPALSSG